MLEVLMLLLVAGAFFVWGFSVAINKVEEVTHKSIHQKDQMLNEAQEYLRGEVIADPVKVMGLVMMYIAKPTNLYNKNDLAEFKKELRQLKRESVNVQKRKTRNSKNGGTARRSSKANI